MKCMLITPFSTKTYDVVWLEAQTDQGSFIIKKGHAPTMLVLSSNKELIIRLKDGKQETIMVPHGILDITREELTVVIQENR